MKLAIQRNGVARLDGSTAVGWVTPWLKVYRANVDRLREGAGGRPVVTERWNFQDTEFTTRDEAIAFVRKHAEEVAAAFPRPVSGGVVNADLYSLNGFDSPPEEMRRKIEARGGVVVREQLVEFISKPAGTQFHVTAGGDYWFLTPGSGASGYSWQKARTGCVCGQALCRCS